MDSGLTEKEAESIIECQGFEMELFYEGDNGLFAVESALMPIVADQKAIAEMTSNLQNCSLLLLWKIIQKRQNREIPPLVRYVQKNDIYLKIIWIKVSVKQLPPVIPAPKSLGYSAPLILKPDQWIRANCPRGDRALGIGHWALGIKVL